MEVKVILEQLEKAAADYISSNITLRELSKKYGITRGVLSGFLLGRNIDIYSKKSKVNNYAFEEIDTEEKAYWLGFLYADGCVRHYKTSKGIELTLQEQDYDHLVKFTRFIDYGGEIKYREKQRAYRVSFGSAKMHDDLVAHGCIEKKSLTLTFPDSSCVLPGLYRHFIRGYFDGDGCIELHMNKDYTFRKTVSVLGTYEFLSGLVSVLPFTVTKANLIKKCKNNSSNNYYFELNKADSAKFLDYIYQDSAIFLTRKYLKYIA